MPKMHEQLRMSYHLAHLLYISPQAQTTVAGTEGGVPGRPCIELKHLARQYSTTSSNDTYTSCMTHIPTSPSKRGHNSQSQMDSTLRNNLYVNPLGDSRSFSSLPCNNFVNLNSASIHGNNVDLVSGKNDKSFDKSGDDDNVFSGQIVQNLDSGITARWQRFNSSPPLQGEQLHRGNGNDAIQSCQSSARSHGGSLKRHRSETSHERHLHFGEVMERTFSSTDNIHDMQGFPKPKFKFRKAVSLAGKLHGSPSTGRKLANYHLITNPKSGRPN